MLTSKTLENISVPNVAVIWPEDKQITAAVRLVLDLASPAMELEVVEDGVVIRPPADVDLAEAERRIEVTTKAIYTLTEMVSKIERDEDMRPALHITNFKWAPV